MKITIINGSARKGNTLAAICAFSEGAMEKHEVSVIQPDKLNIAACKGCGACECKNGCVDKDDTNSAVSMIAESDMIVFASPVYWWGITGQMKLLIDKCYSRGNDLKGKKIGVIMVGGAPVDSIQYTLIENQFECMAQYLSWEIIFCKAYSANEKDELAENDKVMSELKAFGERI